MDQFENQLYLRSGIILNNRYQISKVLGMGGFGVVYEAHDTNLDVRVAVKEFLPRDIVGRARDQVNLVPHNQSSRDDLLFGIERFIDEARVLAKFQDHPGIVKVNESFKANNTAYMVMQYLDGMTLKDYLKRQPQGRMPFDMAIKVLTPIMDALREVHKSGFVHRDISPDNIFINLQKQVKLLDFGAARYAMGEHSKSLTSILKPGYAPMEQYSAKGNQGPWTDVYAVCATIYRCITGEIPPDAMDRMQVECIRSPKQMGVDIPLQAELALMKGLALKPGDRFVSIEALQRALKQENNNREIEKNAEWGEYDRNKKTDYCIILICKKCGKENSIPTDRQIQSAKCGTCSFELPIYEYYKKRHEQEMQQDSEAKAKREQNIRQNHKEKANLNSNNKNQFKQNRNWSIYNNSPIGQKVPESIKEEVIRRSKSYNEFLVQIFVIVVVILMLVISTYYTLAR